MLQMLHRRESGEVDVHLDIRQKAPLHFGAWNTEDIFRQSSTLHNPLTFLARTRAAMRNTLETCRNWKSLKIYVDR